MGQRVLRRCLEAVDIVGIDDHIGILEEKAG